MISNVSARLSSNHSVVGEGHCTARGTTVIEALGIKKSLAEGALTGEPANVHAAARYEWAPDINFMNFKDLIHSPFSRTGYSSQLEELGQLCLLSSKRRFSRLATSLPYLENDINWLVSQSASAVNYLASLLKSLDNETLSAQIVDLVARLSDTPAAATAYSVCTKMDLLLLGQSLEEILPEGTLTNVSRFIEQSDQRQFIRSLSHLMPNLRILEIGTGKSAPRKDIINEFTRVNGDLLCSKYTFTSTGFISGKYQEQVFPNMEYLTLDIFQDLSEQGFEDRQYDLIIAINVLHVTKSLQDSLTNVKKLLHPDGRLLLQELCPSSKWVNYVFGTEPNWWLGASDGRAEEPYITVEGWKSKLKTAGFGGIEEAVLDAEEPHQLTATINARHASSINKPAKRITLLYEEQGPIVDRILSMLEEKSLEFTECKLADTPPAGQDIIPLLDAEKPFSANVDEPRYQRFKALLLGLHDSGIFWATNLSELGSHDP